jgi:hypothetical protein
MKPLICAAAQLQFGVRHCSTSIELFLVHKI